MHNFPESYRKINEYSYDINLPFQQKLYNYVNKIPMPPKCNGCKINNVKFIKFNSGYSRYCSIKCSANNNETKQAIIKTSMERYGVTNPLKNKTIINKTRSTNLIKYGFENPSKNSDVINKIKKIRGDKELDMWKSKLNNFNIKIEYSDDSLLISGYCKKHEAFSIKRQALYSRIYRQSLENICTICNPINENVSNIESDVKNFVENDIGIKTQKFVLENKEIDVYLPNEKFGIEFNGLYYHSNIFKHKKYHLEKTELCEKHGIQLLHVFEDEWINKKEIVKSIIKSKLNLADNKIFARKCKIRELDNELSHEFLEANHIQGNVNAKIRIGLLYENELVSIMTFGRKRLAMGNKTSVDGEYEMLRFCNRLNTLVIGGFSKLLRYFIKTYHPNSILTFADRRYSRGDVYNNNGFMFISNTDPNYWYFNPNKTMVRYHRFGFRKNVLVNEGYDRNKTENEIMTERGFLKIFDCGNKKYLLSLQV